MLRQGKKMGPQFAQAQPTAKRLAVIDDVQIGIGKRDDFLPSGIFDQASRIVHSGGTVQSKARVPEGT